MWKFLYMKLPKHSGILGIYMKVKALAVSPNSSRKTPALLWKQQHSSWSNSQFSEPWSHDSLLTMWGQKDFCDSLCLFYHVLSKHSLWSMKWKVSDLHVSHIPFFVPLRVILGTSFLMEWYLSLEFLGYLSLHFSCAVFPSQCLQACHSCCIHHQPVSRVGQSLLWRKWSLLRAWP